MTRYARVAADRVVEVIEAEDGAALAARYHPDLVASLEPVPDGAAVADGWAWTTAGGFVAPAEPTIEDLRALRRAEIDRRRDAAIAAGVAFAFPDGAGMIDTRNEVDFRNIQGVASAGVILQAQGDTTTTIAFRDAANVTHALHAADAVALGLAVQGRVAAVYAVAWGHKDAVAALAEREAVLAYDIETGWEAGWDA